MIRSDTTIVLNDILDELREIHKLLQWGKNETMRQKEEMVAWGDAMIAKAKQAALEAQSQAYAEHVALYHSKVNVGNA